MKKIIYIFIGLLTIFTLNSCEDLEVINKNYPEFADENVPEQANGMVGGLFRSHFMTATAYEGPGLALWTAADAGTCSWGNVGMRDISSEPRVAFNNIPAYSNMVLSEPYYKGMYATASSATDALLAIRADVENVIAEPARAIAVAKFIQGSAIGSIGMLYDRGFVVTENTDLQGEIPMLGYADVIDSAVAILDVAIQYCENSTFTIPAAWLPIEITFTNVELGQLANTMAARLLTYKSRTAAQNTANNWTKIKAYAEKGLTYDYSPIMDDISWYDLLKTYAVYSGWGRIDMRVINMMDPNMHPWFPASGSIANLPNNGEATSLDARLASDFEYLSSQDFSAERGIYHFSTYRYKRLDYYLAAWSGISVPYIRKAENDMILAEALVRTGDLAGAAAVLNNPANSRKARGNLADVAANETDLLNAIYYEKTIECMLSGEGVEFYDMRRRDMLQAGTFLHLPIPAQQLEVMGIEFYSFGGTTGVPGQDYSSGGWETKPGYQKSEYGY